MTKASKKKAPARKAPAKRKAQPLARPAAKKVKAKLVTGKVNPKSKAFIEAVIRAPQIRMSDALTAMVRFAPLAKFRIAPENPRKVRPKANVEKLAPNLSAHGVLTAVICYEDKGTLFITAGGTRFEAARLAKLDKLPYTIKPKDEAITDGLAEQEGHTPLHPADQAEAFAAEIARGKDVTTLANALGVQPRFVEQRLKLATLHTPILEAFRASKIDMPCAMAWANGPIERQQMHWTGVKQAMDVHRIKELVDKGDVPLTDRLAKFVGEAAYREAGGEIRQELFAVGEVRQWEKHVDVADLESGKCRAFMTKRSLVDKLVKQKLEAAKERTEKEGWGFVEITARPQHGTPSGHTKVKPCTTAAMKAKAGVVIAISRDGKLEYFRNLSKVKRDGGEVGGGKRGVAKAEDAIGYELANHLESGASALWGAGVAADVPLALALVLAQLVRGVFDDEDLFDDGDGWNQPRLVSFNAHGRDRDDVPGAEWWGGQRAAWVEKLKPHRNRLELHLLELDDAQRGELFGFCAAHLVSVRISDDKDDRTFRATMRPLVKPCAWTPSAKALADLPVKQLAEACVELGIEPSADKAAMAEAIQAKGQLQDWSPRIVRELLGDFGEEAKPKKAKAPKGKRGKADAVDADAVDGEG